MIELTEQEKEVIFGIAARAACDKDGDILRVYVNDFNNTALVLGAYPILMNKAELDYIQNDIKITSELLKDRSWFTRIKEGVFRKYIK